jgi:hypothetical protein
MASVGRVSGLLSISTGCLDGLVTDDLGVDGLAQILHLSQLASFSVAARR